MPDPVQTPTSTVVPQMPAAPAPDFSDSNFENAFTDAMKGGGPSSGGQSQQLPPVERQQPAPATAVPAGTSPPPPVNPLLAQARQLGISVNDDVSPEQLAASVMEHYQAQQPYIQYGQSLLPHAQIVNEALARAAQGGVPQPQPESAPVEQQFDSSAYFAKKWNVPQWKEEYDFAIERGLVSRDPDSGMFVAANPQAGPMVAGMLPELNRAYQMQAKNFQDFLRGNPYQKFYEVLQEPLQKQLEQQISQRVESALQEYQRNQRIDRFEQEHSGWMYNKGQSGQVDFNRPTPEGQKFLQAVQTLRNGGMQDLEQVTSIALQLAGRAPQQAAAPVAPAAPQFQATIPFPQQAAPQGFQQTSVYTAPQASFLEEALARSAHTPSAGATAVQSPDAPVILSESDLENLFTNEYRALRGQVTAAS